MCWRGSWDRWNSQTGSRGGPLAAAELVNAPRLLSWLVRRSRFAHPQVTATMNMRSPSHRTRHVGHTPHMGASRIFFSGLATLLFPLGLSVRASSELLEFFPEVI